MHKHVIVVHPHDADSGLSIYGDYTIEYSKQVPRGASLLLTEAAIEQGMRDVLAMA